MRSSVGALGTRSALLAITLTLGAALAPLSASARTPRGECLLTLGLPPGPLLAGQAATLSGALTCPLAEQAVGQSITIEQHTAGTPGYSVVGSATTGADGAFSFTTASALADGSFRALAPELGARSTRVAAKVQPQVSFEGPAAGTQLQARGGARASAAAGAQRSATFSGSVSPVDAGARVVLERARAGGEGWRRIGLAEVAADGSYRISHSFALVGPATVRVVVRGRGMRAVASEPLTYEVAARQNARLTIASTAALLAFGQPLTISGVAAAGAGARLTLLARAGAGGPQVIASTVAGAGGRYQFPAQTPARDTIYRVRGAGASSVALHAGVAPRLTLQALDPAAQAGAPVRVCGAVEPAQPGQVVVLQRADPDGLGFRTVAETTLDASGDYCLEHTPPADSESYRVRVPRGGGMLGAVSAPLQLTVSGAPAPLTGEQEALAPR